MDHVHKIAKLITEDPDIFREGWEELGIEDPFGQDSPEQNDTSNTECQRVQNLITKVWERLEQNPDWDPDYYFSNNSDWLQGQEHVENCKICNKFQENIYAEQDKQNQATIDQYLGSLQSVLDNDPDTSWKGLDAKEYLANAMRNRGHYESWKTQPLSCKEVQDFIDGPGGPPSGIDEDDDEAFDNYYENVQAHIGKCDDCYDLQSRIYMKQDDLSRMPWSDALNSGKILENHPPENILKDIAENALTGQKHGGISLSGRNGIHLFHVMQCQQCAEKTQRYYDQF